MRGLIVIGCSLLALPAFAQTAQPQFAPYTIEQQEHQQILQQLGEVPAKWAIPIMQLLEQLAQRAQHRARIEGQKQAPAQPERK